MTDPNSETENVLWIRAKKLTDQWFVPIVVMLVLIGVIAGGIAYSTHANPPVESEQRVVSAWDESSTLTHQATVQRQNPVFERGEILSGRSMYFSRLSPEVEGTHEYVFHADEFEEVDVDLDATLRFRSVGEGDRTYWEHTERLNERHVRSLSSGEVATITASVNVSDATAEIERIQSEIGSTAGSTEIAIVYTTHVTGSINGETINETSQNLLVIDQRGSTYNVETVATGQKSHESTSTVEVEKSYGTVRSYGPFGVILGSVVCVGWLWSLKRRGDLSPSRAEIAALKRHRQLEEFEDWISRACIPDKVFDEAEIVVDSLEDLVDIAIDCNQRVIEDPSRQVFLVRGDEFHYTYAFEGYGAKQVSERISEQSPSATERPRKEDVTIDKSQGAEALNGDCADTFPDQSS